MLTSGLTNAPISKAFLIYTVASSIALAILDIKHLVSIQVSPHFWQYAQFWRALVWQVAGFANSTEALFAAMLAYHLRVVERAWGKRKTATFLLTTLPYTTLLPPILLATLLRPISFTTLNYLPSGPTSTIFALLAQYYTVIPHTFHYRISTTTTSSSSQNNNNNNKSLTLLLSDKSTTYLVAAQLALSQFPAMLLPAVVGWFVGLAWRAELLPGAGWRVPAWMVGETEVRHNHNHRMESGGTSATTTTERYEDLRRRLQGEAEAAAATGVQGSEQGQRLRRNNNDNNGGGFLERMRGVL